jgi:photosystem II stability/assembly factor-like uncharacterized protein
VTRIASPPQTDADERTPDERVADLEALIEEARQRTRRRRRRNGAVALAALLAAGAALYAGGDNIGAGGARTAEGDAASAATLDRAAAWSTPTGPPGFSAGIVLHPTRPGALYLYAGGRVYRSTDGGRRWKSGPPIALKLDALTVDLRHGSILYAGTNDGVLKSTDAGRTWRRSGLRPPPGRSREYADVEGWVYSIAVDPADSRNVYAITRGLETRVLLRSRDAGATWHTVRPSTPRDMREIHAAGSGILYTAGRSWGPNPAGVLRSTDGGTTWRGVLDGTWSLAVDPNRPETVWAVGELGVRVTRDGGTSWRSAGPPPARDLAAIVLDPLRPRTLYLSTRQNEVFRSVDGGRTWHPFGAGQTGRPGPAPGLTELLAIDPRKPGTLYAGDGLGVVKSVDGGATWGRADAGVVASHVRTVAPAASNPATIYAAGFISHGDQQHDVYRTLSRSDDRGHTWVRLRTDDGSALTAEPSVLAVDPRDHRHVLIGGQGITGSHDGGATWTSLHGLPHASDVVVGHIAFAASNPRQVYAVLYDGAANRSRLIRSSDGGTTWKIDGGAGVEPILALAVDPKRAETVYAGYEAATSGGGGVATSSDGGRSWRHRSIPDVRAVGALAVAPSDPDTIYAVTDIGLARSVDGGDRWRFVRSRDYSLTTVVVDPERSETVYVASGDQRRGVLRSTDGGETWRPFGARFPTRGVADLAVDASGNRLYVGLSDGGLTSIRVR